MTHFQHPYLAFRANFSQYSVEKIRKFLPIVGNLNAFFHSL